MKSVKVQSCFNQGQVRGCLHRRLVRLLQFPLRGSSVSFTSRASFLPPDISSFQEHGVNAPWKMTTLVNKQGITIDEDIRLNIV